MLEHSICRGWLPFVRREACTCCATSMLQRWWKPWSARGLPAHGWLRSCCEVFLQHLAQQGANCRDLAWIIGGGERTPEQRIRDFAALLPTTRYIDAYGLTESCSGDTMMESGMEMRKIGSVGRALAHVEIEIRAQDQMPCRHGEEGEVCLRGPKITRGYLNDPRRLRRRSRVDGCGTGDVGYLDPEGFLYVTDRKKDMILSGGENIASSEIERVVGGLRQVADVAAFWLAG